MSSFVFEGNTCKKKKLILQCLVFSPKEKCAHYFLARGKINKIPWQHICMWKSRGSSCKSLSSVFWSSLCVIIVYLAHIPDGCQPILLHPQWPPSQHFVNFWHLIFSKAHVGASAPYLSTTLSLENDLPWCYGCRGMQNTSPDTSTSFSLRDILLPGRKEEKEALNHE